MDGLTFTVAGFARYRANRITPKLHVTDVTFGRSFYDSFVSRLGKTQRFRGGDARDGTPGSGRLAAS